MRAGCRAADGPGTGLPGVTGTVSEDDMAAICRTAANWQGGTRWRGDELGHSAQRR